MYNKRIKIIISIILLMVLIITARLLQMQLISVSTFQEEISKLKQQRTKTKQFKTIRGRILDRNNLVLAESNPKFQVNISYELCSALDQRLIDAKIQTLKQKPDITEEQINQTLQTLNQKAELTKDIITKCTNFGIKRDDITQQINKINDRVWNMRYFLAWLRNNPDKQLIQKYGSINAVPTSVAAKDFEANHSLAERLILTNKVSDIAEMKKPYKLLELNTNSDIFTAQLEFMNIKQGLDIVPISQRIYPYNSIASQLIGWVGPENDSDIFDDDKLLEYRPGDLSGKRPGIEYVCEPILRGRRGKELYDIDKQLIRKTKSQIGSDVTLTIDIELQKRIEQHITDINYNPNNADKPTSVVIIDTNTGEILAMVSIPTYNLNTIRSNYSELLNNKNRPLINRAINALYPAGSVVKPLIAIAGLETACITPDTIISCPAHDPPPKWPKCWIQRMHSWLGHDNQWDNTARNAIKGSCNIFFSRLADQIETRTLQKYLYDMGYGHHILSPPSEIEKTPFARQLREADGIIASVRPKTKVKSFDQIGFLKDGEKRYFGIGQASMRVTPLQVATSMSIIANKGIYRKPFIIKDEKFNPIFMDINSVSFDPVWDGMSAVVNETQGSAEKVFAPANFSQRDVKVFGKTGSTQAPANAWFAGFANDSQNRSIAFAVLVEGGEHGSTDAGPIASEIITLCIDAQYIGNQQPKNLTSN